MECMICINEDNDLQLERIITKCNHYFHKKCLYTQNYNKDVMKCPYCQEIYIDEYTTKMYSNTEIPKEYRLRIKSVKKLMKLNNIKKYVISGSFAVYMYMLLFRKKTPGWKYGDIDIYYTDGDAEIEETIDGLILYVQTDENDEKTKYKYNSEDIIYVDSYISFLLNDVSKNTEYLKKLETYDLINIKHVDKPHHIVETFDIDASKIAMYVYSDCIEFYIHNSFYVDSYDDKKVRNENRIKKYRERGFELHKY